jgi:ABC-type transport system involved in multi-copper enzyme maturation permease subunit
MTEPTAPLATTAEDAATIEEVEGPAPTPSIESDPTAAASSSVAPASRPPRSLGFARTVGGIAAIGVKETRGRMRGKRAFIVLTIYLVLLAGFAAMVEILVEQSFQTGFGGSGAFASAAIGQGIFTALLMLMTLQVVFLAPSSTAGGISLEREKQTLELLIATPISSVAIVIGKLLSALVWVFLLIAASIPLMAVVFVFGGIGPETVLAGYLVLLATALGLGSFGLACSSLVKRTTASTAISIFGVLAISIGTAFILIFWTAMGSFDNNGNRVGGLFGMRAPAVLAYVNPFIAQADVMCTTESSFGGGWCSVVDGLVPNRNGVVFTDGGVVPVPAPPVIQTIDGKDVLVEVDGGFVEPDVAPQQVLPQRDAIWVRSVITWLLLSVLFLFIAIQAVSPTRRWRPSQWRGRSQRSTSA